eukprot:10590941-Alexandrium_andersonii.AAC.1
MLQCAFRTALGCAPRLEGSERPFVAPAMLRCASRSTLVGAPPDPAVVVPAEAPASPALIPAASAPLASPASAAPFGAASSSSALEALSEAL